MGDCQTQLRKKKKKEKIIQSKRKNTLGTHTTFVM